MMDKCAENNTQVFTKLKSYDKGLRDVRPVHYLGCTYKGQGHFLMNKVIDSNF